MARPETSARLLLVSLVSLLTLSLHLRAQPVELRPGGEAAVTITSGVELDDAGHAKCRTSMLQLPRASDGIAQRPATAPLSTRLGDADARPGLWIAVADPLDLASRRLTVPARVTLSPTGTYSVSSEAVLIELLPGVARVNGLAFLRAKHLDSVPIDYTIAHPLPGTCITVPLRAETRDGTTFKVAVATIGPVTGGAITAVRPAHVPVGRVMGDGAFVKGLEWRNATDHPLYTLQLRNVNVIKQRQDETFEPMPGVLTRDRSCDPSPCPPFPPGFREAEPLWSDADVIYSDTAGTARPALRGPPSQYRLIPTVVTPPPSAINEVFAQETVDVAAAVLSNLVENTTGTGRCQIDFQPLAMNTTADTTRAFVLITYAQYRIGLEGLASDPGETIEERAMYTALPHTPTCPAFEGGRSGLITHVILPRTLADHFGQIHVSGPDMNVRVNTSAPLHYPFFVPPISGSKDLTTVLAHEFVHGMGFGSLTSRFATNEQPDPQDLDALPVDVFRFAAPSTSAGFVPSDITNRARDMTDAPGRHPVLVALLGNNAWFPMSIGPFGDGNGSAHWRERVNPAPCIGLMNPEEVPACRVPGYLWLSDKRALDIIGWNIDIGNEPLAPNPCALVSPAHNAAITTSTPILSWTDDGTGGAFDVAVYQDDPAHPFQVVARQMGISPPATSFVVPLGSLLPNAVYR